MPMVHGGTVYGLHDLILLCQSTKKFIHDFHFVVAVIVRHCTGGHSSSVHHLQREKMIIVTWIFAVVFIVLMIAMITEGIRSVKKK